MGDRLGYAAKLVWLNAGFYIGLVFLTAVSIVFVSVPALYWFRYMRGFDKGAAMRQLIWLYGHAWTKLLAFFVPLDLQNCDRPLPSPCIITPNHQSFFDTYCFGFMPERNLVLTVRAWPFRIPFYGPYMRLAGYLNIESGNAMEFLRQAKEALATGACIVLFPEGTRSVDGRMGRFHSGAFHLAVLANVPVVPVCMEGTGLFLHRSGFLLRPARIFIRVLDPVHPAEFAEYGDEAPLLLCKSVKKRIQKSLDALRSQCPQAMPSTSNRKEAS